MHEGRRAGLWVGVLALVVGIAAKPLAATDRVHLTLDDALALLRRQGPEELAEAERVRAAHGDVLAARALPNPTLSLGVGNFALGTTNPPGLSVGDTIVGQVGLQQELLLWGRRGARITASTGHQSQAEAERKDLDRRLVREVRVQFAELLVATERVRLAEDDRNRFQETVRVSEARRKNGEISPAELERIRLEQRGFEREVAQAQGERQEAAATLLPMLGLGGAEVDPAGGLDVPDAPQDTEQLIEQGLAHRPDLLAAEAAVHAAEAELELAKAQALPDPTIGIQYTHSEFGVSGDLRDQAGATLSLPLPLFDRNQGAIVRAGATAAAARHVVDRLRATIPQEVRTAVLAYGRARAQSKRFAETYLAAAKSARTAAEASYREGASSLLELLEAERTFIQTQRDSLDSLRDVQVAAADIRAAAALEVEHR